MYPPKLGSVLKETNREKLQIDILCLVATSMVISEQNHPTRNAILLIRLYS